MSRRRSGAATAAALRGVAVLVLASHALAAAAAGPRKPLFIAPVIEGLLICDDLQHNENRQLIEANSYCTANGRSGAKAAAALLDELEPGGAKGAVQVGYTITVQLLSLYRLREGRWVIDESRVDRVMEVLDQIKRPVVLYLAANHFDTPGPITQALESDPVNLMHLADGSVPRSSYFGNKVVPYTLQTDESIPVNRYPLRGAAPPRSPRSPPCRRAHAIAWWRSPWPARCITCSRTSRTAWAPTTTSA